MHPDECELNSTIPTSWDECQARGWQTLDVLLVTGDSFVDHPSFGVALVARLLESWGCRVAVLAQPQHHCPDDFLAFPAPSLFCGITAGNLDSVVANYSGNGKVRDDDSYSPDGNPYRGEIKTRQERRRPDRATLVYTALARHAYPGVPIILGGIEASLRRFAHYDFKQQLIRASILTDAKADLLIYGMAERSLQETVRRRRQGLPLNGITGTCERLSYKDLLARFPDFRETNTREWTLLPSYQEIFSCAETFLDAEITIERHCRAQSRQVLLQKQQSHWLLQNPAPLPLSSQELDSLYQLPFTYEPNPRGQRIPALEMIKDSVTIVRGCPGNCSFCAISRHQGGQIVSRTRQSIVQECRQLTRRPGFQGTISDLGGPTANLYACFCEKGGCKKRDCLYPHPCPHLKLAEEEFLQLLQEIERLPGVRHLFVSSGLRMELLLRTPQLMRRLITHHTPGRLKIAPEHSVAGQLRLMHKEPHQLLKDFVHRCRQIGREEGKKIEITPYTIISHPGSTAADASRLKNDMAELGLNLRQAQDFTPTPGTLSTAMYVCGLDIISRKPIPVPRGEKERREQRQAVQAWRGERPALKGRPQSQKKQKKK